VLVGVSLLLSAGAIVALATGGSDSAEASGPTNYCDATLRALQYTGDDTGRFHELLEPVQDLAPKEVAAAISALRRSMPESTEFAAARKSWDYYNNNHCCQCLQGQYVPTIQEYEASQS
jgi:hypothetical protein